MVQTRSPSRAELRRTEILRQAAEVFRRQGFHGAGMREIAKGLGMAPGALYYYFESKEDLLLACQMLSLKRLLRSAREVVSSGDPPPEKLRRLVSAHLSHVLDEFGGSLAHIEFHVLPEPMLARVVGKRDAYEALVRRVITEGVAAGSFRPVDVKLTTLALLGALNWTVVWWRPEGGHDLSSMAGQIAQTFLSGISA